MRIKVVKAIETTSTCTTIAVLPYLKKKNKNLNAEDIIRHNLHIGDKTDIRTTRLDMGEIQHFCNVCLKNKKGYVVAVYLV